MPNSCPSLQSVHEEQIHDESDAVSEEGFPSLNQETLNRPDPTPKSVPDHSPPPQPVLDPDYNSPDEDDDDEEVDDGTPAVPSGVTIHVDPPIAALARDATLSPPCHGPKTRRVITAGKWKKSKRNKKKQQAIEKKLESLKSNLNPIPFIPHKILDFTKHEKLMKKLGLWEFANIDFDRNIRTDLLAQLIATYEAKSRVSHVNDFRINVTRAALAKAFQLPKKGSNASGMEADLECESLPDESIGFITELVNDWVLLHEDTWIMQKEVADWLQLIRDGHPEKVDWASLFWFMVEKEVKQGGGLRDCYYASHLQHLMKSQREELFQTGDVEDDAKGGEIITLGKEGVSLMEGGPSTELTLGKDEKGGGTLTKDVEMMDVEKCKGIDDIDDVEKEVEEEEEGEEHGQWLLEGKKELGEHFMRPCNAGNAEESEGFELKREDENEIGEEEDGDQFHEFPRGDDEGFTGNFLGAMDMDQLGFNSQDPLCNQSSHISNIPPFFNNSGKRVAEHDHSKEGNKKLRINNNELWNHDHHHNNKPALDFGTCIEQIQHVTERARMLYQEKEQALEQSNMNQQILLSELQKRDSVIEHLHKTRLEEMQKKDGEIYRLERELYFMGDVLEGYRKALKETRRAFLEYRGKARVPEEPTYKDTGEGGLMLTSDGIEKLRRMREDEFKLKCLLVEQKVKEVEDDLADRFGECAEKVGLLDTRLSGLEDDLVELGERRKAKHSEQGKVAELVEETKSAQENVVEDDEEKVVEDDEETVVEDEEEGSVSDNPQAEEKVSEVEENHQGDEERLMTFDLI